MEVQVSQGGTPNPENIADLQFQPSSVAFGFDIRFFFVIKNMIS